MQVRARWLGSPRPAVVATLCAVVLTLAGCDNPIGPPRDPDPPPPADSAVLVGAGDIAICGSPGADATAYLLDSIPGTVFTAGDNAYPKGTAADFSQCYDRTWGRHLDRTFPTPGNHDYGELGMQAKAYFDYFGSAAGPRGLGYYKYTVGSWRVIALNSEFFSAGENGSPNAGAAATELQWFKNELAINVPCTIAIWHRPLYSSGQNGPQLDMRDLYKAAYDGNVDIVINGHDHNYERFAPQDADGRRDNVRGVRQFVVGTGGIDLYKILSSKPNSETFQSSYGVLKLTLSPGAYAWDYVPVPGQGAHDTGNGVCH